MWGGGSRRRGKTQLLKGLVGKLGEGYRQKERGGNKKNLPGEGKNETQWGGIFDVEL